MTLPEPPKGWGADEITRFIDNTRLNAFASYANLRAEYRKLAEVDQVFRKLIDNLTNTKDWFAAFFLLRSHSAFLASCHMAMAGQVAEAYAALRLCLENGLYGLYLSRNAASRATWLRRHESQQAKRRVRDEFTIRALLKVLTACDGKESAIAERLYERCIDYGGHPNERALTQSLKKKVDPDTVSFQIIYLTGDPLTLRFCLKTTAQVGASVLGIFRLVFRERFDLSGLSEELTKARRGL